MFFVLIAESDGRRDQGSWDGDEELQGIIKLLDLMKSLKFCCQLWKYLHFMTSTFPMAPFRGAISRDLSVMKLHCLMTSTTCLPPLCRGMCSGVLDLEGIGDICVCVCVFVCFQNACCYMFVMEKGNTLKYKAEDCSAVNSRRWWVVIKRIDFSSIAVDLGVIWRQYLIESRFTLVVTPVMIQVVAFIFPSGRPQIVFFLKLLLLF